jgi:hypothetical protein
LTLRDKEIRSLKAAAKKSIKVNKDEIARISKDSKVVLGARAKTIKTMVKQVIDGTKLLEAEKKKGKHTTELLSSARLNFVQDHRERDECEKLAKVATTALRAANKKIDSQLEAKLEHTKHMEQIKWGTDIHQKSNFCTLYCYTVRALYIILLCFVENSVCFYTEFCTFLKSRL